MLYATLNETQTWMITSKGLRRVSNAAIGDVVTRSGETVSCSRLVWVLQVGGGRNNNNLEHSLKLEYTDFDAVLPTQVGALNGATWIYRSTSHSGSQYFWRLLSCFGLFPWSSQVFTLPTMCKYRH